MMMGKLHSYHRALVDPKVPNFKRIHLNRLFKCFHPLIFLLRMVLNTLIRIKISDRLFKFQFQFALIKLLRKLNKKSNHIQNYTDCCFLKNSTKCFFVFFFCSNKKKNQRFRHCNYFYYDFFFLSLHSIPKQEFTGVKSTFSFVFCIKALILNLLAAML